jgi:hypothetical protein
MDRDLVGGYGRGDDRRVLEVRRSTPVRTIIGVDEGVNYDAIGDAPGASARLFAINRDGSNLVRLLGNNHDLALAGAPNLGSIVRGCPTTRSTSSCKSPASSALRCFVDLRPAAESRRPPSESTIAWWLDVEGQPCGACMVSVASFMRRDVEGKWKASEDQAQDLKSLPD